jgi:hypothetical protein
LLRVIAETVHGRRRRAEQVVQRVLLAAQRLAHRLELRLGAVARGLVQNDAPLGAGLPAAATCRANTLATILRRAAARTTADSSIRAATTTTATGAVASAASTAGDEPELSLRLSQLQRLALRVDGRLHTRCLAQQLRRRVRGDGVATALTLSHRASAVTAASNRRGVHTTLHMCAHVNTHTRNDQLREKQTRTTTGAHDCQAD